jgi:hypothetical protein
MGGAAAAAAAAALGFAAEEGILAGISSSGSDSDSPCGIGAFFSEEVVASGSAWLLESLEGYAVNIGVGVVGRDAGAGDPAAEGPSPRLIAVNGWVTAAGGGGAVDVCASSQRL